VAFATRRTAKGVGGRRRRGRGKEERRATELSLDVFCLDLTSLSLGFSLPPAALIIGGGHSAGPKAANWRFSDEGGKRYA